MLVQCWASVLDGGQTLHQHWVSVSPVNTGRWFNVGPASQTRGAQAVAICIIFANLMPNFVNLMPYKWCIAQFCCSYILLLAPPLLSGNLFGHPCSRWTSIEPALGQCVLFAGSHETFIRCCFNVGPASQTMGQH